MTQHAFLAPSSAHRVIDCPASLRQEAVHEDVVREYTAEGTLAHDLASMAMVDGVDIDEKVGKVFEVPGSGDEVFKITVTQEMVDYVKGYLAYIAEIGEGADVIMGEQRVRYGPLVFDGDVEVPLYDQQAGWYGVKRMSPEDVGFGRLDAAAVFTTRRRIKIVDLKYGYTRVWAEDNEQGMLYALGVLFELSWMGEFDEIEIIIYQPRVDVDNPANHWVVSVADLMAFAAKFREAALDAMHSPEPAFNPSTKACQFCNARTMCPARKDMVLGAVGGDPALAADFDDLTPETVVQALDQAAPDWLGSAMDKVDMIEDWCKDIRAETERRLLQSHPVPGWKLVEGRMGNRAWADEATAEKAMKGLRLKVEEMYKKVLISPPAAEKVLKADKAKWAKLQKYITRSPGRPSVAPASDPRPPLQLTATAEDFV